MTPFVVTLLIIVLLLFARLVINLVSPPSDPIPYVLSPSARPKTFSMSCDACYYIPNCDECPVDCDKCSLNCPPNCATCTPSCSRCAQDCPLDCDKCKTLCPPNCDKCKEHCQADCAKLTTKCELPFLGCQAFISRISFSGGYLASAWKLLPSAVGYTIVIGFIPRRTTGGLFSLTQMGFYIEDTKVKMYFKRGWSVKQVTLRSQAHNKLNILKFNQGARDDYFTLSLNSSAAQRFSPKLPGQVLNSTLTIGRCIGNDVPAASKVPFIGCMEMQINGRSLTFNSLDVKDGKVTEGCE